MSAVYYGGEWLSSTCQKENDSISVYLGLDIGTKQAHYAITGDGLGFETGIITRGKLRVMIHDHKITTVAMEYTGRLAEPWSIEADEAGVSSFYLHTVERRALNRLTGASVKTDPRDSKSIANVLYMWADPERRKLISLADSLLIEAKTVRAAWQLRGMVASVDQLVEQRTAAKQRIISAGRAGNYKVAELWRKIADGKEPEIALEAAEEFAADAFPKELDLLLSIPHVGRRVATYLLAQLMPIERFEEEQGCRDRSYRNLKRYTGTYPRISQSGEINERARMAKSGNPRTRGMLYMVAMGEVEGDTIIGRKYRQLVERGMPKRKAIVAASLKLLSIAYAILRTGQPYFDPKAAAKPAKVAKEPLPADCLTQADAAKLVGVSRQAVSQLVKLGKMESRIHAGKLIVPLAAAREYAERRRAAAESAGEAAEIMRESHVALEESRAAIKRERKARFETETEIAAAGDRSQTGAGIGGAA